MAPKGEAEREIGSDGTSFQGSLAAEDAIEAVLLMAAGLNVFAFALRLLGGEVAVEPPVSVDDKGIDRASLPRLDIVRCMMGVVAPDPGGGMMGD
jgi:hypothetical protein